MAQNDWLEAPIPRALNRRSPSVGRAAMRHPSPLAIDALAIRAAGSRNEAETP